MQTNYRIAFLSTRSRGPEGNAFLINGMAQRFSSANVRLNALVLSIRQQEDEVLVTFMDTQTRQFTTLRGSNSNLCRTEAYRQLYHTESALTIRRTLFRSADIPRG